MSIFTRPKPVPTPEEASVTDTATAPAPPSLYPSPSWQDSGPFAVPVELRQAYSEAVPKPEVELAREEGKGKGFTVLRLFPPDEAARLAAHNDGAEEVPEVRGDGWRRFRVPVSSEEWLHVRRMGEARKAVAARSAAVPSAPVPVRRCVACGAEEPAVAGVSVTITAPARADAAGVLGIVGPCCRACQAVAAVVLAEREVRPGVTRRQAVAEAAGLDSSGVSRAERDRQAVREMVADR